MDLCSNDIILLFYACTYSFLYYLNYASPCHFWFIVSLLLLQCYCGADCKEVRLCGLAIVWGVVYTDGLCFFTPHATTCILFLLLVIIVYSDLLSSSLLLLIAFTLLHLCVSRTNRAYPATNTSRWECLEPYDFIRNCVVRLKCRVKRLRIFHSSTRSSSPCIMGSSVTNYYLTALLTT